MLSLWHICSSREWLERGGEGPLFAPLPPGTLEALARLALEEGVTLQRNHLSLEIK